MVLSDALAVQSQGPKVLSAKVVFGSQQMFWDLKECFGISKMYWQLGSQKKLTVDIVEIVYAVGSIGILMQQIHSFDHFFEHSKE